MTKQEALEKIEELKKYVAEIDITDEDEIFLLSAKEYKYYAGVIPHIKCPWWLYTRGNRNNQVANVEEDGSVDYYGCPICNAIGVRPALKYSSLKSKITESVKGDEYFIFGEVRWKIINKELKIAIAEMPLKFRRFDIRSSVYEGSEIEKCLLDWFEEANK